MNDLMIPQRSEVPAYILNPELARQANEEALAGISTGYPPRVKLAGKQFSLVDGNGGETPYPPAKLVAGPDGNVYLPVIVLRAKAEIQKTFYAGAFNPSVEASAPDCFSNNGVTPDPSAAFPQCDTCAGCEKNAFGSGKDQAGNPTAGKACTDSKVIAVFIPGHGIHSFKIPPASLKNFGIFVKQLSANGIPLGNVKTFVGFDMTATFPVLVFKFGGYIDESLLPKLAELAQSLEAEEIVNSKISGGVKKQAALPAPAAPAAKAPVVDDLGLGDVTPPPASKRGRPAKPQEPVVEAGPKVEASGVAVSDDDLRAALGL